MQSFTDLLQQGTAHAWLFGPTAILLGALHGLEPGHSKTMMAAFIIAIRGTVTQAILLGLSAALSHTAVVWVVALGGQYLGRGFEAEVIEPYLQLVSAAIIVGVAVWMFWRTARDEKAATAPHHHHGEASQHINTGHGILTLDIFEDGVPPRALRLRRPDAADRRLHGRVRLGRAGGTRLKPAPPTERTLDHAAGNLRAGIGGISSLPAMTFQ